MCLLYQERASDLMGEDPLTRYKRNYLIWFASSCLFSLPPILSAGLFSGHWCDWPFNQPFTEKRSACGTSLLKTSLRLLHYIRYLSCSVYTGVACERAYSLCYLCYVVFPQKKAPLSFVTSLIGLSVIWQQDPLITVMGSFPFCRAMPACAQRGPCCLAVRSRCGNVLNQRNKYRQNSLSLPYSTDKNGPPKCILQPWTSDLFATAGVLVIF